MSLYAPFLSLRLLTRRLLPMVFLRSPRIHSQQVQISRPDNARHLVIPIGWRKCFWQWGASEIPLDFVIVFQRFQRATVVTRSHVVACCCWEGRGQEGVDWKVCGCNRIEEEWGSVCLAACWCFWGERAGEAHPFALARFLIVSFVFCDYFGIINIIYIVQ